MRKNGLHVSRLHYPSCQPRAGIFNENTDALVPLLDAEPLATIKLTRTGIPQLSASPCRKPYHY